MTIMRHVRSLALYGLGMAGFLAALMPVRAHWGWTVEPAYSRPEVLRYEAFSPDLPVKARHVTIGSCETAIPIVANDTTAPDLPTRAMPAAWLGNVLNYLLRTAYQPDDSDRFFDLSVPNTYFPEHTNLLLHALRVPNLKTVIYVNGVSLNHRVNPDTTLELVATLERLEQDYPAAAASIRAYKDLHLARPEFAAGVSRRGENWRALIDPVTLTLQAPGAATVEQELKPPADADRQRLMQYWMAEGKKLVLAVTQGPSVVVQRLMAPLGVDSRHRNAETVRELNWAAAHDDLSRLDVQVDRLTEQDFLDGPQRDFHHKWMVMLADLVAARGAHLVIYAQPMVSLSRDDYERGFKPHYVDRARQWLAGRDVTFVDHTVDHDLTVADFTLYCPGGACANGVHSNGYWANILGRIKQGRRLIEALRQERLLDVSPQPHPQTWKDPAG